MGLIQGICTSGDFSLDETETTNKVERGRKYFLLKSNEFSDSESKVNGAEVCWMF